MAILVQLTALTTLVLKLLAAKEATEHVIPLCPLTQSETDVELGFKPHGSWRDTASNLRRKLETALPVANYSRQATHGNLVGLSVAVQSKRLVL